MLASLLVNLVNMFVQPEGSYENWLCNHSTNHTSQSYCFNTYDLFSIFILFLLEHRNLEPPSLRMKSSELTPNQTRRLSLLLAPTGIGYPRTSIR